MLSFEQRTLDDVRTIVDRKEEDDRRFAAVARISDINLGMYRSFMQPWLRALVTPQSAEWSQRLHPLRLPYELISDRNPAIAPIAAVAEQVREHRQPVSESNPFLIAQEMFSNWVESSLNIWQEMRDSADERTFMGVYGSPLVQDLAGLGARSGPPRKHPGVSPEHRRFMEERTADLRSLLQEGGLRVAAIRMLLYVSGAEGGLDERSFALIRKVRAESDNAMTLQEFKDTIRDQALILTLDSDAAIQAMPRLLEKSPPDAIRSALKTMKHVLEAAEPLSPAARESLAEMERIFEAAERRAQKRAQAHAPARLEAVPAPTAPVLNLIDAAAQVPSKVARPHPDAAKSAATEAPEEASKAAPEATTKAAAKSASKAVAKSAAKAAPSASKAATKSAAKPAAKPATKSASKTAAKPATKRGAKSSTASTPSAANPGARQSAKAKRA
ncbi:hypothetical protein D3C86_959290 [compost metagenome]